MVVTSTTRAGVERSLASAPVVGVVRTSSYEEAESRARLLLEAGLELVEITFTVPRAVELVTELLARRGEIGPPWLGMGTVTTAERAQRALAAGAEFLVSPNTDADVARLARQHQTWLIMGALTPSEISKAWALGADLIKIYPLPPVGGPAYLSTIRQPLGDIPMLAAGGFEIEEIPAYRRAGATAFGIGDPLLGQGNADSRRRVQRALALARGEEAR
jgi:2-dehydro-3-deoxyphosphogluconate aldolase/(4S)-4-hydroxy-2-oxoglutarate aldolase